MKKFVLILLFVSVVSYADWEVLPNGIGYITVYSLANGGNNIFAGTYFGVYKSTNNGDEWFQTPLNNPYTVYTLLVNGNYVFAGTGSPANGVFVSTNLGSNWTQTPLNNRTVNALTISGNKIFAGTLDYGVYISSNNGATWTQSSLNNLWITALVANGSNIFAATGGNGLYLSTNSGSNWTQTSFNFNFVWALGINGNNLYAGVISGLYYSTNNGTNWVQTTLSYEPSSLVFNGNNIFVSAGQNGVYVSNDNGLTWAPRNEGISGLTINELSIHNNYLFAGTNNRVYRRPLSELIGIHPIFTEIPNQFSLSQNYPNPFNPATKIRFALPKSSFATIVVYDALGRELEMLVNEQLTAGTYEADWNADRFSSGVYYYKLIAGDFTETKKMVLVK